jgi:3-hydroxyacyl-CoA dehydrogenase
MSADFIGRWHANRKAPGCPLAKRQPMAFYPVTIRDRSGWQKGGSVQDFGQRVWHGDVALVTLDGPNAGAFGPEARGWLLQMLQAEPAPRAMVLAIRAAPQRAAILVADDPASPRLSDVVTALTEAGFPVVSALPGAVSGPLVELALAGDVILAATGATLAIPDIVLGQVPGGGATQTLPRRVGARIALDILLSGLPIAAGEALRLGMVDQVVPGDPVAAALAVATGLASRPRPERPSPGLDAKVYGAEIAAARGNLLVNGLPGAERMVDAVEAALVLPLAQGLTLETTLRADLAASDDVHGLRATAEAIGIARRMPKGLAGIAPAPVTHLYVEGMSPATTQLAYQALAAGIRVTLAEADRDVLGKVLKVLAERQDAEVAAGRLAVGARDADWARLATVTPAALVPEGVDALLFGPGQAARVAELAAHLPPDVPRLVLGGGAGTLGLTLAPSGRIATLSGITAGPASATARAFLGRIGVPVIAVGSDGTSPGAALATAGRTALERLMGRGLREEAIQVALTTVQATTPALSREAFDPRANQGRPLAMPQAEIIARWWAAMAAAGLDCLAAGTALCPADIDHLMVAGYGFPRRLGGPMHQADRRGLLLLRQDLRLWSRDDRIWATPPLLDKLISEGLTIRSLNPQ